MTMSIGNKMKYGLGALAATVLVAASMSSCKNGNNEPTDLEKAKTEMERAHNEYRADSLDFEINAKDSVKAKEVLAQFQNLRTQYLLGHPKTGNPDEIKLEEILRKEAKDDPRLDSLDAGISRAQRDVDNKTGKTVAESEKRYKEAKDNYRMEELFEKYKKDSTSLSPEERYELTNLQCNAIINTGGKPNTSLQKLINILDNWIKIDERRDSVMKEFNKLRKGDIDESDNLGKLTSQLDDTAIGMEILLNKIKNYSEE